MKVVLSVEIKTVIHLPVLRRPSRDGLHSSGLCCYHHLLQPDRDVKGCQTAGSPHGWWRRERAAAAGRCQEPGLCCLWHAEDGPACKHRGAQTNYRTHVHVSCFRSPLCVVRFCDDNIFWLQPRQNLLQAAGNVGQASGELLSHIGETDTDPQFQVCPSFQPSCVMQRKYVHSFDKLFRSVFNWL